MCREKAPQAGLGDEVWEAGSSSDGSDHETDSECGSPQHAGRASPANDRHELLASAGMKPLVFANAPVPLRKPMSRCDPTAPQGGLLGLLTHLRNDNSRLREALVEAQRELEALAARGQESNGVDFSHLLALVKEFGDGLGGFEAEARESCDQNAAEVFAICSPRGEAGTEPEVTRLREELEQSQKEVAQLRAELALRDAELLTLRGVGDWHHD